MTEFTRTITPLVFPSDEEWIDGGVTIPENSLTDGSTLLYVPTGVTYTYDANVKSWTDK